MIRNEIHFLVFFFSVKHSTTKCQYSTGAVQRSTAHLVQCGAVQYSAVETYSAVKYSNMHSKQFFILKNKKVRLFPFRKVYIPMHQLTVSSLLIPLIVSIICGR